MITKKKKEKKVKFLDAFMEELKGAEDRYLSPERPRNEMGLFDLNPDNEEEYPTAKKVIMDEFLSLAFAENGVNEEEGGKLLVRSKIRRK